MSAPDARGIAGHWDAVYGTKAVDDVSWYQPDAGSSTRHVLAAAPPSAAAASRSTSAPAPPRSSTSCSTRAGG